MANPLQIVSKSQYVEQKAQAIFQSLLTEYRHGTIRSKTELAYRTYRALMDFYEQIGKPSLVVREAGGAPVSADYNAMIREIASDLRALFSETNLISGAITDSFGYVETERQDVLGKVGRTLETFRTLAEAVSQGSTETTFRDTFLDRSRLDIDMVDGTVAEVNQQANALVLGLADSEVVRDGVTITVLPDSTGLPGNTHQVIPGTGFYRFQGQDNMHLDLQAILDGNMDTWYEHEAFTVPSKVTDITGGLGFQYKEGATWLKADGQPLRLSIALELDRTQMLNWISLAPFIPSEKGAGPGQIVKLLIEDGKGAALDVADGNSLSEERVFIFPKMKVKRVTLGLEQHTGYDTLAGHFCFKELDAVPSIFDMGKVQAGKRVDGPRPSLEDLGIHYDPATGSLQLPSAAAGDPAPDRSEAADRVFSLPEMDERTQAGLEAVPAQRFALGIRDVGLASYRFKPDSSYVSKPFETSYPVRRIVLDADQEIPAAFPTGNWVAYDISIDNGRTWYPIALLGTLGAGIPTEYLIGTRTPAEGRQSGIGYLEPAEPVNAVRVRIRLTRPDITAVPDSDYFTPVVYEYRLYVRAEGGQEA